MLIEELYKEIGILFKAILIELYGIRTSSKDIV